MRGCRLLRLEALSGQDKGCRGRVDTGIHLSPPEAARSVGGGSWRSKAKQRQIGAEMHA